MSNLFIAVLPTYHCQDVTILILRLSEDLWYAIKEKHYALIEKGSSSLINNI